MSEPQTPGADEEAPPSAVERIGNVASQICLTLAALCLTAIVVINGINVFSRYVLFWALSWAEEAMVFLMIASVFLGAVSVTWDRAHIRIDALIQSLSSRMRKPFEWLAVIITTIVLWPIGYLSFEVVGMLKDFDQRSDALHFPVWIPQSAVPISLLAIPAVMAVALWCRSSKSGGHGA